MKTQGPLHGVKLVEFAGIGPAPFATALLSDMGADVIRIDRPGKQGIDRPQNRAADILARGRKTLALDLRQPESVKLCIEIIKKADVLIEGYRPGVMERLGLGPDVCLQANKGLVYGRMTGWGQHGPLAHASGHDINYLAITGALHAIGPAEKPVPPLNVVGDFGGGSLYLAMGVLAALIHSRTTGEGQVVDAAIVDGTISLMSAVHMISAMGLWSDRRESNMLDGGAPFYRCYECADGKFVSIGPLEPEFYSLLLEKLGLNETLVEKNYFDKSDWPDIQAAFEKAFMSRSRDEWAEELEGSDTCFAPVLSLEEAPGHSHLKARGSYETRQGVTQSAPAPRFSKTPGAIQASQHLNDEARLEALKAWGVPEDCLRDPE